MNSLIGQSKLVYCHEILLQMCIKFQTFFVIANGNTSSRIISKRWKSSNTTECNKTRIKTKRIIKYFITIKSKISLYCPFNPGLEIWVSSNVQRDRQRRRKVFCSVCQSLSKYIHMYTEWASRMCAGYVAGALNPTSASTATTATATAPVTASGGKKGTRENQR